jgi:hypothetical protein
MSQHAYIIVCRTGPGKQLRCSTWKGKSAASIKRAAKRKYGDVKLIFSKVMWVTEVVAAVRRECGR